MSWILHQSSIFCVCIQAKVDDKCSSGVILSTLFLCTCRYLLTDQSRLRSVNDIMPMIGARFYTQLDASQMRNDVIEEDLAKVCDCKPLSGVCVFKIRARSKSSHNLGQVLC